MNFTMSDNNYLHKYNLNEFNDPEKFQDQIEIDKFPIETFIEGLKTMKLIRRSEEVLGDNVENGKIVCPCHLSIGQEAIPVGISNFLNDKDFVFGNHRSHGHYLALTKDSYSLFAEVLGKVTGCAKGMGGSMHIVSTKDGFHGSVPIVSATIPIAVGAGLTSRLKSTGSVAVSYFGDGTTEEGTFHESLNLASYYDLPVLFVCENNLFSSHMHIKERQPFDSVSRFAEVNNIENITIDGNDLSQVLKFSEYAVGRMRKTNKPFFIEAVTYRWRGHVGPDENIDVGLRRKDDLSIWKKRDPIGRLEKTLLNLNHLDKNQIENMNHEIDEYIKLSWEKADNDEYPNSRQLYETVYYK